MILEREGMQRQRIQSFESMLNSTVGRDVTAPLGGQPEPRQTPFERSLDELIQAAYTHSPEIKVKEQMVKAAEAKLAMARKEYYPDVTLNGTYFSRDSKEWPDMWSATATFNVPIYFKTKQDEAVREGLAGLSEAKHELAATRLMVASAMRDSYTMIQTADHLMGLYRQALIPKNYQDYELALSGYASGKIEALAVIATLKSFLDSELLYWVQFAEREKAIARHETLMGPAEPSGTPLPSRSPRSMPRPAPRAHRRGSMRIAKTLFRGAGSTRAGPGRPFAPRAPVGAGRVAGDGPAARLGCWPPTGTPGTGAEPRRRPCPLRPPPPKNRTRSRPPHRDPARAAADDRGQPTALVARRVMGSAPSRTVGRVEVDEQRQVAVTTKFEGWVEKLHADATGKFVRKGEPLAEIYSPELFATQQEFLNLLRLKKDPGGAASSWDAMLGRDRDAILEAARERLRLWDITDAQVRAIETSGKPIRTLTLFSPISGYVIQKMVVQGMRIMPGESSSTSPISRPSG